MRKFLFFYLNTGGGHRAAANTLQSIFASAYPDVEVKPVNGFSESNKFCNLLFEQFYRFSCTVMPSSYSMTYRFLNQRLPLYCVENFLDWFITPYLVQILKQEQPTDIVCLHFCLVRFLKRAIRKVNPSIRLTTIVLDPFTFHTSWVYEKKLDYLFFSETAKDYAVQKCGVPADQCTTIPFLLNQSFRKIPTSDEIKKLKEKHSLPTDKKICLLTGGGEGLPLLLPIIAQFAAHSVPFTIIAVCGRDTLLKKRLDELSQNNPGIDLRVYGFVDFMPDLVKVCDCAVIKAGPASLMEVLVQKKPVILCHFIYGQELGNVEFAIKHDVGSFTRKPYDICKSVEHILTDEDYANRRKHNFDTLPLDCDSVKIADWLMAKV